MNRSPSVRILLVDDDEDSREVMVRVLRGAGHVVTEASDGTEALALDPAGFDLILTDLQMPGADGRAVLLDALKRAPQTPVVVFTAYADPQSAMDLMSLGAYDYVPRPVDLTRLKVLVQRAYDWHRLKAENSALRVRPEDPSGPRTDLPMVGTSPAMLDVYKVIAQVAPTPATVLLQGDSGTGKELIARTIHARSGRSGPFVGLSCGALPEEPLLARLFGTEGHPGVLVDAVGGTLFLDDIDELPARGQGLLLRALEERAQRRSTHEDVRVITATAQDLHASAAAGRFREELLFRLQVVTLAVPPLSARAEDVPLLVDHFLAHFASLLNRPVPTLAPEARHALLAYDWPGNVRELAQTLERAVLLARGGVVLRADLPSTVGAAGHAGSATHGLDTDWPTLAVLDRRYIDRVLQHTGGNKTRAAEVLGIDRRTLSRLFARERQGDDD
jgi:DNA-binding NtrC family response regulator